MAANNQKPGKQKSRCLRGPSRAVCTLLFLSMGLSGCASYTMRSAEAMRAFESGDFKRARQSFGDVQQTKSAFLTGAEAGMTALVQGDWTAAVDFFGRAAAETQSIEGQALIGPQNLSETLLSFGLNDSFQAYRGEGFERVMLHACTALAYLAQGLLDDVYVEARLANELLESEEELYEKQYVAGGLGHFVSALTYELLGRFDEAYIDYRRMLEKGIGEGVAGPALVRLSEQLRFDDDHRRWVEQFGEHAPAGRDEANVVVIAGIGLAPYKRESTLSLPGPDGILQISIPKYQLRSSLNGALGASGAGGLSLDFNELNWSLETELVEDVARVSQENLDDRVAWLAAKSTARAVGKYALTKKLGEDHGSGGQLAGMLFTAITERADVRSWLTLPETWRAARGFVPAGDHSIQLTVSGGERLRLGRYRLEPGETLFILARTLGGRAYAHVLGGVPLEQTREPTWEQSLEERYSEGFDQLEPGRENSSASTFILEEG